MIAFASVEVLRNGQHLLTGRSDSFINDRPPHGHSPRPLPAEMKTEQIGKEASS